ncbi:MAG TPA: CAP domain-containing protein [Actinomycetes bacterium]|nr:CAP domain-containing protein [Actinomycetes bacterium]
MTVMIVLPLVLAWFLMPADARPLGATADRPKASGEATQTNARVGRTIPGKKATTQPPTTRSKRKPAASTTTRVPATTHAPTTTRPPSSTRAAAPSTTSAPATSRASSVADKITQELFARLNAEREARGLDTLEWDDDLANMAADWSRHMASTEDFSHRDLGTASSLPGIDKFSALGENIAWVEGYPDEAMQLHTGWMHSDGHRSNMLQPGFDSVGIAVVCSGGRAWATQNFGRLDDSSAPDMTSETPPENPIVATDPDGLSC